MVKEILFILDPKTMRNINFLCISHLVNRNFFCCNRSIFFHFNRYNTSASKILVIFFRALIFTNSLTIITECRGGSCKRCINSLITPCKCCMRQSLKNLTSCNKRDTRACCFDITNCMLFGGSEDEVISCLIHLRPSCFICIDFFQFFFIFFCPLLDFCNLVCILDEKPSSNTNTCHTTNKHDGICICFCPKKSNICCFHNTLSETHFILLILL